MNPVLKNIKRILHIPVGGIKFIKRFFEPASLRRGIYASFYERKKLKDNVILYESFFGRGMLCGPYALFLEALSDERFKDFKHVWVMESKDEKKRFKETYKNYKNVKFINYGGVNYVKYLTTAKYLVNNVTFPSYYTKKKGQVYINTWHGIPLKTLGYDMPDGCVEIANVERNFLCVDYLISANSFLTDVYKRGYKLEGIFNGKIVEEGYPRLDLLFRFSRDEVLTKLEKLGIKIDRSKKIILYAPTWKGVNYAHAEAGVEEYFEFKETLEKTIDTSKYQILVKPHQRVFQLAHDKMTEPFFVPATIDANEILSVTDILVSDFSSIFYDFLATKRPILFYIKDIETYKEQRGMYHSLDTHLPGPNVQTLEDLAKLINDIDNVSAEWMPKYEELRQYANAYCDGHISKKILDMAFFGKEDGYNFCVPKTDKKKIFMLRGKMLKNGITSSMINLLNRIDYDKYDITLLIVNCKEDTQVKAYRNINPNVRVLYRNSTFNVTFFENVKMKLRHRFGSRTPFHKVFENDWIRTVGDSKFDVIVDFEGYNVYFQQMILQDRSIPKYEWLHNDMHREYMTKMSWLPNIFHNYKYFDGIVACGKEIGRVNKEYLCEKYIDSKKLTYAHNVIDFERVNELSKEEHMGEFNGKPAFVLHEAYSLESASKRGKTVTENVEKDFLPEVPEYNSEGKRNTRFVAVGRLSQEKNHKCLVEAFAKLLKDQPDAYLYILGDGPLLKEVRALADSLGVTGHVLIPGHVSNPYIVMKHSDCLILPSLHEGQPLVVNEARALGLPIILSDFSSVNGVLIENGQLLIGHETEDIYKGLLGYFEGKVPKDYVFDYEEYNRRAVEEFYTAIGVN